jgi:spermidine/putrescine transport system substrate-binding protein
MQVLIFFSLLLLFITGCQSSSDRNELRVFMWSSYIKPDIIKQFEQKYNCEVMLDTYDTNEAMYAKLKLGANDYDIIFPSNYFFDILNHQKMLQPINFAEILNYKNLDPTYHRFTNSSFAPYGVIYMISPTGIAYRTDRIPHLEASWGVFGLSKYKGRMTLLNDLREALGAALRELGYSVNTIDEQQIKEAADLLISWKKNLAKFESEQYKNGIASAEYLIVQGYAGDIFQIMQENPNIDFLYPDEGALLSIDYLAIPKDAPNPKLAHKFINFLLEGEIAAENMGFTFFLSPNIAAYKHLSPELRNNPVLFPPKEVLDKIELIENVDSAYPLYIKAWEEVKSSN